MWCQRETVDRRTGRSLKLDRELGTTGQLRTVRSGARIAPMRSVGDLRTEQLLHGQGCSAGTADSMLGRSRSCPYSAPGRRAAPDVAFR